MVKPIQKSKSKFQKSSAGKNAMGKLLQRIFSRTTPKPVSASKKVSNAIVRKKISHKKTASKIRLSSSTQSKSSKKKKGKKSVLSEIEKKKEILPQASKLKKRRGSVPQGTPRKSTPSTKQKKANFHEKQKVPKKATPLGPDHESFQRLGFSRIPSPEKLCSDFRMRINGAEDLVEFAMPMAQEVGALKKQTVIAVSVGGSNIKRGVGVVFPQKKEVVLQHCIKDKLDASLKFDSPEKFWEKIFSAETFRWMRQEGEGVRVALTLGCPLRKEGDDFVMVHGASKYNVPSMGPFAPGDKPVKKPVLLRTSLLTYLQHKTKLKNIQLFLSQNDVFSVLHSFSHHRKGKINGVLILGSGANVGAANVNFEAGHYTDVPFSKIEQEILKKMKLRGDIECIVSGKILREVFASILSKMVGKNHIAVRKVLNMPKREAVIFIFDLAYNPKIKFPIGFAEKIKPTLIFVAKKLLHRMAHYSATLLLAAQKYVRRPVIFFAEGSLLTKCPPHIHAINQAVRHMIQNTDRSDILITEKLPVKNNSSVKNIDLDASFIGTFVLGAEK